MITVSRKAMHCDVLSASRDEPAERLRRIFFGRRGRERAKMRGGYATKFYKRIFFWRLSALA
jgi:hypothetical protein